MEVSYFRLIRKGCALAAFLFPLLVNGQESTELAIGKPDAIVNLKTKEGVAP